MKVYAALLAAIISPSLIAATHIDTAVHTHAEAQPSSDTSNVARDHYPKVAVSLAMGVLAGGEAKEFIYGAQSKNSQLDWEIKTTPTANAALAVQLSPLTTVKLQGWSTLNKTTTGMNDYDWLDPNKRDRLTDWSNHPNTDLKYANELDLNLNQTLISSPSYQIGAVAGYQQNRMRWSAKGGNFQYSIKDMDHQYIPGTAMAYKGKFNPNQVMIGYQQKFSTPYIGVSAQYNLGKLELNSTLKYSPWVKAESIDQHYARDIEFKTELKDTHFYGLNLNAGYYVKPNIKLFSEVNWSEFKLARGPLNYISNLDKKSMRIENAGGLSNQHFNLNIGAQVRF